MPPGHHPLAPAPAGNDTFCALLYRFLFFDWLFADLSKAGSLIEQHAAWRHNREMRKYLPTYLYRWGALGSGTFLTGYLCERVWQAQIAASCCFTGFSVTVAVMVVIVVAWLCLANPGWR